MTLNGRLTTSSFVIIIFLVGSFSIANVRPAHAQSPLGPYSVNSIANPGFENGVNQWVVDTYNDGNVGSTITANNTLAVTGYYSARFDISSNRTANNPNVHGPITSGHITLYQVPTGSPSFSAMTNRTDGLNLWLYIQPKFSGFSLIEIRIKAVDTTELDYFFANPATTTTFTNYTKSGEVYKPVKSIVLPMPPFNQWIHFQRNLGQDWTAPMQNTNGTIGLTTPGFNLTETIRYVMLEAGLSGPTPSTWYGETAWIDDVVLFVNSTTPPPPPPPRNNWAAFIFQDTNGNPVNNLIGWKLFNSTGFEVTGYRQNDQTLTLEPYTIQVYYPTVTTQDPNLYTILRQRIPLNITSLISLEMFPLNTSPWSYVAFNHTVTNLKTIKENTSALQFSAQGNQIPYLILVGVSTKPVAMQRNNEDPTGLNWSYDSNLGIARIPGTTLGNFSIFLAPPISIPSIKFQDITGNLVTANISWRILDPSGAYLTATSGQLVQNETYTFQAYYEGYRLYSNILAQTPPTVRLALFPLTGGSAEYIAFNGTVISISVLTNTESQLEFQAVGQGPHIIVVNVPGKPVSIERDGIALSDWTYNSTTGVVSIQASQLGTFTLAYSATQAFPIVYVGSAIGVLAFVVTGLVIWERTRTRTQEPQPSVEKSPKTQEQAKPKTRPQKDQRRRR
ncbi:MAG TPA: hypothetical protein VFE96_09835 [Candidatus Bathyarchaeia archaeon]|nr:hypothetical protein [Candidatus Bathyarchaeia archaeon]